MKPQSLVRQPPTSRKLTSGCPIIDGCFRGGVPCNSLTEIVAESGCGKTQLCLQLSLSAQLPISCGGLSGSSLYLHSEFPFPFRRLHQLSHVFHLSNPGIYADHNDNPCDHVFVQSLHSADHLLDIMPRIQVLAENSKTRFPLKLIVLDSVAALFRSEFDNTPSDLKKRASLFFKISGKLKQLAKRFDLVVVVTNQVVDFVESSEGINGLRMGNLRALYSSGRRVVPALGLAWANCVNSRLFLSRDEIICKEKGETDENCDGFASRRTQRHLHVVFSPHLPGSSCEFVIQREGIFGVHRRNFCVVFMQWGPGQVSSTAETVEEAMEAMFGIEEWQFERIISESDLDRKNDIVFLVDEVDIHILPSLKKKEERDLKDGEAIDLVVYDEDTKESFRLKLRFERPLYHLRDTTELYDKKGLAAGQRIGFRYEGQFAMLVVKVLD